MIRTLPLRTVFKLTSISSSSTSTTTSVRSHDLPIKIHIGFDFITLCGIASHRYNPPYSRTPPLRRHRHSNIPD